MFIFVAWSFLLALGIQNLNLQKERMLPRYLVRRTLRVISLLATIENELLDQPASDLSDEAIRATLMRIACLFHSCLCFYQDST